MPTTAWRDAMVAHREAIAGILGYPLFLMWFEGTKSFDVAAVTTNPMAAFSLLTMVVDLIALVIIAICWRRITSLRNRPKLLAMTGSLIVLSTSALLAPYAGIAISPLLAGSLGALAGFARAVLTLAWMEVFCQLDMRHACIRFSLCTIAGTALWSALGSALPDVANIVVGAVAGVACAVLVGKTGPCATVPTERPTTDSDRASADHMVVTRWSFPLKPTLLMGVFAISTLLVSHLAGNLQADATPPGTQSVVSSLFLLLMTWRWSDHLDIRVLGVIALPFACVGLLGSLSTFAALPVPSAFSASMAYYLFSTFMYALLFNISFRHGVSPLWLFGFSRAPRVAAAIAVPAITESGLIAAPSLEADCIVALMVVLLVGASSLLVTGRSFDTTWGIRPLGEPTNGEDGNGSAEEPPLRERCIRAAYSYGLTKREEEVLALLTEGLSTPEIERRLVISNGTARNHIQHVYRKLGVHSREEARRLVSSIAIPR